MARKRRHQQTFERAVQAQIGGQLDEAARLLRRLLRERPRDHEARHQRGLVRWASGDVDAALTDLEAAAAQAPTNARYQGNLGNAYQVAGRTADAIAAFERAAAIAPDAAAVWSNLGVALRVGGEVARSAEALRRAVALEPGAAVAWQNLSSVLEALGDLDGAVAALESAAAAAPADPETWTALGKLAEARDDRDGAEAMYRRAVLCDQAHAPAWSNLGGLLRRDGRLEAAIGACEKAIAAEPGAPDAYTHFGLALREQGHPEAAAMTWQRGLQARATPEALLNLQDVLDELGYDRQATQALADLNDAFPAFAPGWLARGRRLLASGSRGTARMAFERALSLEPDSAEARHFIDAVDGRASSAAPEAYVRQLFDEYAARFEQHLTGALAYRTPEAIAALLGDEPVGTIVDLGCGTGLVGPLVRERCARLVGVDLSPRMIEQARLKGTYDELQVASIEPALAALGAVDVAIAADVFIYFGDLAGVLGAGQPQRVLFSVEVHDGPEDWVLRETGRYAHSRAYIEKTASDTGFTVNHVSVTPLRKERGAWVEGLLVALQRA